MVSGTTIAYRWWYQNEKIETQQIEQKNLRELKELAMDAEPDINYSFWRDKLLVFKKKKAFNILTLVQQNDNLILVLELIEIFFQALEHFEFSCENDLLEGIEMTYLLIDSFILNGKLQVFTLKGLLEYVKVHSVAIQKEMFSMAMGAL